MSKLQNRRKSIEIIASILTHDNTEGLSALLWAIYFQTVKPKKIILTNTGKPLLNRQILCILNFISQTIPIELRTEKNTYNYGKLKTLFIKGLKNTDVVWMLEDDLVFDQNMLKTQLEYPLPNVPMYEEQGFKTSTSEKYTNAQLVGNVKRVKLGCIYGLLFKVGMLKKVNYEEYTVGSDLKIIKELMPYLVKKKLIHTKPKEFKEETYSIQEKLFMGELK